MGVIQENVQKAINGKYALFCLGFGFDVSYKFLEKMALSNGGIARRIYENADAALQLQVRSKDVPGKPSATAYGLVLAEKSQIFLDEMLKLSLPVMLVEGGGQFWHI